MLQEKDIAFTYREYTKEPLTEEEIRAVLQRLGLSAHDLARSRDAKKLELDLKALDEDALIAQMALHPSLIQRPIADTGTRAALGRPVERILEVV